MGTYLTRHLQVLFATLGAIRRTPIASINTILIIAITLLLPSLLYVVIKSAQQLGNNWQGRPQISVFIQPDLQEDVAQLIFEELRLHPAVSLAEFISPQQALEEFRSLSGMDYEIEFLGVNPLPASIVVMPGDEYIASDKLLNLKEELLKIDGIDDIRLDLDWADRFRAILATISRVAGLLSLLLGIALILIVGNTIKLLILNRRQEIEITRLVGGSNAFVRRPFLYYGTLYGLFGALLTLGLLVGAGRLVAKPLAELSLLYQQQSLIQSLSAAEIALILLTGSLIGWLAARWSVTQHLSNIKPR